VQILVDGLINGLTTVLLALAFTVVYLPTRIFYLALGGVYTLTPFIVWFCLSEGWGWCGAVTAAIVISVGTSLACELLNHAPLEQNHASSGAHLVSSLGISIILVQTVALLWGNETKLLRTGLDTTIKVGSIVLTYAQITTALVSVVAIACFYFWLQLNNIGLQFRALADNSEELALRGYNVRRLRLIAFGLSGLLGSVSALLVAYDVGFNPEAGMATILLAVVAVIVGGRLSFWGPLVGGIALELVRSGVVWILSARWQEAITFLLLTVFLLIRPDGLLGKTEGLEAKE
jgi:branched-chain amino acid transport system permease protein